MEILFFVSAALLRNSQEPINIITAYYVTICMPTERNFWKMACLSNSIFLKTDFEKKRSNDFESQLIDMAANIESKEMPVKSSIKDLQKTFEIKDHSRTFGRSSRSSFIQRWSKDLRDQSSFKKLPTFFMIEDHSWILGRIFRSKIVQRFSKTLRDQVSFEDF